MNDRIAKIFYLTDAFSFIIKNGTKASTPVPFCETTFSYS